MVIHHELISKKKYQRSFWIDIKDIKQVMKTYIEMRMKESEIPKPKDDDNNRMYG